MLLAAVACGRSSASTDGGVGGPPEITPDPHTPDSGSGCGATLTACHPYGRLITPDVLVCTDTATDAYNCGACDDSCAGASTGCVASACTDAGTCGGVVCGGECVTDRYSNPDHCGGCTNRCGERELCTAYACVSGGGGGGDRCASPLVLPVGDSIGFHFDGALVGTSTFSCGPSTAVRTRWLRKTATGDSLTVKLDQTDGADLVIEVFAAPCAADGGAQSLGCSRIVNGSTLTVTTTAGHDYLIAVGAVSGSPSGPAIAF